MAHVATGVGVLRSDDSIYLAGYNAVFIDIAKVASSSLKTAFAPLIGIDLRTVGGNPHDVEFPYPPEPPQQGGRFYPYLYTFGFVRNPWDRLVSCYRDKICGEVGDFTGFSETGIAYCLSAFDAFTADMSFTQFVHAVAGIPDGEADDHFRSQHLYLTDASGDIAVDFVGRFENLEPGFRTVTRTIGLPSETVLPRLQCAAKPVHYADYYSAETRRVTAARFAQDIELFSYQFD